VGVESALRILGTIDRKEAFGGGPTGASSRYFIDSDDGESFVFDYTDIALDGFRTVEVGERFRFSAERVSGSPLRARLLIPCETPSAMELLGLEPANRPGCG